MVAIERECPICETISMVNDFVIQIDMFSDVNCPQCGKFTIKTGLVTRDKFNQRQIANASGWIREQQNAKIDSKEFEELSKLKNLLLEKEQTKFYCIYLKRMKISGKLFCILKE
jgi:uncharacterized Zn finger protein